MDNLQARRDIIRAWREWDPRPSADRTDSDAAGFWDWLQANRADLLAFEWPDDKRYLVSRWVTLDDRWWQRGPIERRT